MTERVFRDLSRRERQIMEIVYAEAPVAVRDVRERMPDAPSYSAVRTTLGILEDKGHLRHDRDGARYLYSPAVPLRDARQAALDRLVETFFGGSVESAAVALLRRSDIELTQERLEALADLVERAREEGR